MTHEPSGPEHSTERDRQALTGPPRWVKVSAIVAGVVILIANAVMLLSGGQHGPARHGLGTGEPVSSPGAVHAHARVPSGQQAGVTPGWS